MIVLKNVSKYYGRKLALEKIDLSFAAGRVYGIVGENGAGKTTLFKCIAGLESHQGAISSPYEVLKNHLGYLETNPIFMSYMTGWEYLKLMCAARKIDTEDFEEQNTFGLPLQQYAESYSTGMKKKLALMGLLLRKNDIFILDEPFNGVDIQSNMIITEIIEELKSLNKTVLISSHIFSTLRESCDEMVLLSKGKVQEIVHRPDYQALESRMKANVFGEGLKRIRIE